MKKKQTKAQKNKAFIEKAKTLNIGGKSVGGVCQSCGGLHGASIHGVLVMETRPANAKQEEESFSA